MEVKQATKVPLFPSVRFGMLVLWFTGSVMFYLIRFNFSVGIVCMTVDSVENTTSANGSDVTTEASNPQCGELADEESQTGEFEWDRLTRGLLNSAFFMGYLLTHIAGGVLTMRFGPKWVIFCGMVIAVTATVLFEVASNASEWALFAMRILLGIGCGVFVPSIRANQTKWVPVYERTIIYSIQSAGYSIGSVVAFAMSGALCDSFGWPWVYYVPAMMMAFWMVFWVIFGGNTPDNYRFISQEERAYIVETREKVSDEKIEIPWKSIFTSMSCVGIFLADFCQAWGGYTTLTSGAQYMKDVLKFDIQANGFYNALPHLIKFVMSVGWGFLADVIRRKGLLSTPATRKLAATLATLIPCFMVIALSFMDCERKGAAIAILCISEGFAGLSRGSIGVSMMEVAPKFTAVIGGISNCFSTMSGILAPIAAGLMTTNGTTEEWQRVFYLGAGMYFLGWLLFFVFVRAEVQPWARLPSSEDDQNKETAMPGDPVGDVDNLTAKALEAATKPPTTDGFANGGFDPEVVKSSSYTYSQENDGTDWSTRL